MSTASAPLALSAPASRLGRQPYLAGLDNSRAIAALGVCLFHFLGGSLPERELVPAARQIFQYGYLGVPIFFVVSGFIIPYSLFKHSYQVQGLARYLWRRATRLAPPAYAAMLLTGGQLAVADSLSSKNAYLSRLSWDAVLHNALFTVPFTHTQWIVGACWTLATEFQFYVFLGLLFPLLFRQSLGVFVVIYLAMGLLAQVDVLQQATFFKYSPLFALGGLTLLWQHKRCSGLAYAGCLLLFTGLASYSVGTIIASAGLFAVLCINMLDKPIWGLAYLGRISYSLYLLHVLVGTSTEFVLVHFMQPSSDARRLLIVALCTLATVGAAALFYRWVERPFLRLASLTPGRSPKLPTD